MKNTDLILKPWRDYLGDCSEFGGHAKGERLEAAKSAMQGLLAHHEIGSWTPEQIAHAAVMQADLLIAALNEPSEVPS